MFNSLTVTHSNYQHGRLMKSSGNHYTTPSIAFSLSVSHEILLWNL